jgi:thiol-disulfide isomerase/thioredoxin
MLIGILVFSLAFSHQAIGQKSSNEVQLRGILRGFGGSVVLEEFSDLQHMIPETFNPVIKIGKDSSFSLSLPLSKPGYYRLGRNKLYLSPGDNLDMQVDYGDSKLAKFKGKGSEANQYLTGTPFPKGGSYVDAGRNLTSDAGETVSALIEMVKQRQKELAALNGVTAEFKRLEFARIRADLINSIEKAPSYARAKFSKDKEMLNKYISEFQTISKPTLDSLVKNFVDPSFLQIEVYRDLQRSLLEATPVDDPKTVQIFKDYEKGFALAFGKIKPLSDKSQLPVYQKSVDSIQTKKYRDVLTILIKEKMKFGNGDLAIDLKVRNTDGTKVSLSSLKGKLIYIDLWATWCGPCLAEMPSLEELKKKYENNAGIAIVSLSVDDSDPVWLKNLEKRKPGGIQWRIDRAELADYQVQTIPRYIIIDKNFKVADFNAGKPSEKALQDKLDRMLIK